MVDKNVTRTDLLNFLAEKYDLQRYLEIGVQVPELNFDKIKCKYKVSVDPDPNARATYCCTSDEAFKTFKEVDNTNPYKWDLIFIDGLHTAEQVKKDFENALKVLSPNGFIVLHDCNPLKEEHAIVPRPTERGHWNGDVYKFAATIGRKMKRTVSIDNGCMVVAPYSANVLYTTDPQTRNVSWDYFDKNRKELLNLISWDEFIAPHSHL